MIWDDIIKKQVGILILGIWAAFGFVLFELLNFWEFSDMLILFMGFVWYALDVFVAAYLWHVFKVRKEDVPKPILTKVESTTISPQPTVAPDVEPDGT